MKIYSAILIIGATIMLAMTLPHADIVGVAPPRFAGDVVVEIVE